MGGTGEDIAGAEAGAGVPIGTVAMKSALMEVEVTAEGMMMTITMKVEAGGAKPQALAEGGVEAGAQVAGGIAVLLGKEVKRGEQKLLSGTGRKKKQSVLASQLLQVMIIELRMTTMATRRMVITTMPRSNRYGMDILINDLDPGLFSLSVSFSDSVLEKKNSLDKSPILEVYRSLSHSGSVKNRTSLDKSPIVDYSSLRIFHCAGVVLVYDSFSWNMIYSCAPLLVS